MPFRSSVEKADYETKLSELIGMFGEEPSVLTELALSFWCGGDSLSNDCYASNH